MIIRDLKNTLEEVSKQLPVIAILGPRQSGKTTLAQTSFKNHIYLSLEDLDTRARALNDPREFLEFHRNPYGLILDEIQNAPELLSYIQTYVDRENVLGYFILTGSQNFLVNQAVTQTLAGRIAILTLLPLSIAELRKNNLLPNTVEEFIFKGSYPRLYAHPIQPSLWYASYTLTYIERDVRQLASITDLTVFQLFMKLCAGHIGRLVNISSLANECGIDLRVAKGWLSILQASYIIFLLQPYYKNFNKRLVKTPKLYFYDTGLASALLQIESVEQLQTHYLRGELMENAIIAEFLKDVYNSARIPHLYFWRDNHGNEIDCLIEKGTHIIPVEVKAGRTVTTRYFKGLNYWNELTKNNPAKSYVIYAADENQKWKYGHVLSWKFSDTIITDLYS